MSLRLFDTIHFLPPVEHRARRLAVVILSIAPLLFGCLALYLGQDSNWDLRNYHWYNAYAFLNDRYDFDLLPSQTPWFYNPTLDVPFYLIAAHAPAVVAGFVLGAVQGLNFILLFMLAYAGLVIANTRQKVIACAALALLGMLGGGGIALIGTTFYDNVTSLGLFSSALLFLRFRERLIVDRSRFGFMLAMATGVPAGFAMGLKLPCFTFCFGLCAAILFTSGAWRRRLAVAFAFGLGVLIGDAITYGPWAFYLQDRFASPMFPYFNNIFKAPLGPVNSARDMQYVPRSLHDFLLFPYIFTASPYRTGEIAWRDWRVPVLYTLLPLAVCARLAFGRGRAGYDVFTVPHVARYLLWAVVFSYVAWLAMFGIYRYAVPIEMLAPLLIVFSVAMLPVRLSARALIAAFLLVTVALSVQGGTWGRRAAWQGYYMGIDRPELGDVSDMMLLMAGFEPYSYVAAQFPPEIPVVRIQSNFASPDQDKAINWLAHARVEAHRGRFLLLMPNWQHKMADEALTYFRLAADWKACQTVRDRLNEGTVFDLCPVSRVE